MQAWHDNGWRKSGQSGNWMTLTVALVLLWLLSSNAIVMGSDYIWREDIVKGSDRSTYRCPNGLVARGNLTRDVLRKCGEPTRRTRMQLDPNSIWIYRFGTSDLIVYMAFTNDRLQRIHSGRCWEDNPHCN